MYYYLDLNQIRRAASNSDVYNRGVRYYNEDRIKSIDFLEKDEKHYVKAIVAGNYKQYATEIVFDPKGILLGHGCSCEAHEVWRGACKHVICLMTYIFNRNKDIVALGRSSRITKNMLKSFEQEAYEFMEADPRFTENEEQNNKVSLLPTLSATAQAKPYLTFAIGRGRKYILKNISEFLSNIRQGKTVSYGTNLEFAHTLPMFDALSIRLLRLMQQEYEANTVEGRINLNYYYMDSSLMNKALILSKTGLDDFFNIYKEEDISVCIMEQKYAPVVLQESVPDLKFCIVASESKLTLSGQISTMINVSGKDYDYIFYKDILHRVGKDYNKTLTHILYAFNQTKASKISIAKEDINTFMTFAYPRLKEFDLLAQEPDLGALDIEFREVIIKLYFDVQEDYISCRVLFCYDDTEINPLSDNTTTPFARSVLEEYKTLHSLQTRGFVADVKSGLFLLKGDDLIYDFCYSPAGLSKLSAFAETYATDEFTNKSIKTKSSSTASFGVRFSGDLLEVDFHSDDYNLNELLDIMQSIELKKKYHKLKDGRFLSLEGEQNEFESSAKLISGLGLSKKELEQGKAFVPKYRAVYLSNLLNDSQGVFSVTKDREVDVLATNLEAYRDLKFEIPKNLKKVLRGYQKEGYNWLRVIASYGFGAVLADDMGLGKTLQIITVLLAHKIETQKTSSAEAKPHFPSIVVAPTSLIYNWEKEIQRFAPELTVQIVAGTAAKRQELLESQEVTDVYITTYDTLKRDISRYENIQFQFIVADEAQNIKNPATQNSQSLKSLKGNVRFALTGTPIENSLSELWSIFDFIMPGYLYSNAKFTRQYETPIIKNNSERMAEELRRQISPFILRRLKTDVLKDLPEKIETTLYADMTKEQKKLYAAYLLKAKGALEDTIGKGEFNKKQIDILAQLTRLRQICCHPGVFLDGYDGGSGKLELTVETIERSLESKHRILIFSQFTSMLNIIETNLSRNKIKYFYLDGSTDSKKRLEMTERFNSGENQVFLISLKAGGTGLNLTGADIVIHFDPWWNPAVMDQASDRAHRYGQKRTVQVINIVAKDTVEEKILQLQSKKKDLVDNVLKEGTTFINKLSESELLQLFAE